MNLLLKLIIIPLWIFKFKRNQNKSLYFQEKILKSLLLKAKKTQFGIDHHFSQISNYEQFKQNVPIRHYDELSFYMDKILIGEENVIWPTPFKYMLMTSKSTGDIEDKFLPISPEGLKDLIRISFYMLLNFALKTKNFDIFFKRGLYLTASPKLAKKGKYPFGLLSGVSYYLRPKYLRNFSLPTYETNIIEDWEVKIKAIENELVRNNLGIIVGTPPWVNTLLINLHARVQKTLNSYFKDLRLFIYGGAPVELYQEHLSDLLGKEVYFLENYPASEGFIGFQDEFPSKGFLLQTNFGIYYEFISKENYYQENYERISLKDIEPHVEYAIILNTNSGLFGYVLGDIVKFTTLNPFRFSLTGRLRHFIKLNNKILNDGDLTIPLTKLIQLKSLPIIEFTFAPNFNGNEIDLYYETNKNVRLIARQIEDIKNLYSFSLRLVQIKTKSMYQYMQENFRLGGQYKITRVRNDRNIVEFLEKFKLLD